MSEHSKLVGGCCEYFKSYHSNYHYEIDMLMMYGNLPFKLVAMVGVNINTPNKFIFRAIFAVACENRVNGIHPFTGNFDRVYAS